MRTVWTAAIAVAAAVGVGLLAWLTLRPSPPSEPMPCSPIVAPAVVAPAPSPSAPAEQSRGSAPTVPGGLVPPPPADDRDDDHRDDDQDDLDDDWDDDLDDRDG